MTETTSTAIVPSSRAEEVKARLTAIKDGMIDNVFELGDLLSEARANSYPKIWGFESFPAWLSSSGLDIGERQAFYLMRIVESSKELGISREQLKKGKISKLREIFTLDPKTHGEDIKLLVAKAETAPLEEIRESVQKFKAKSGEEVYTFLNLKVSKKAKETVIDPAIELVRKNYGNTVNADGQIADITLGKAIELVCVEYLNDPNQNEPPLTIDVAATVEKEV